MYGGTANSIIARCNNATLSNCLTPGNWSSATITDGTNATGANQVMTKLHINSTADQPFSVIARRSTNEIRAYVQGAGGCSTGALSFSATSVAAASGATLGNAYASLARDSSNRWHLAVNDSTTSIRYFNELTGTVTAAWNAVSIIETTTLGAAGATRGSIALDETGSQVLVSYGRTAGGTPLQTLGNMVLAFNNCPTGGTGCATSTMASPSSAAGMVWENPPFNTTGQIQLATSQVPNTIAVAATSLGRPAAAYVDFSVGSATTGRLKYAIRSGNSASDHWPSYDIASGVQPQSVALAFDHANRPWIAYYDATNFRYYLTTTSTTEGSGSWLTYQFPIATAAAPTLPAANNVALAMYVNGGVHKPVMIVSNSGAATKVVRAALFNPTSESWANNTQVDTGVANFSRMSADYDANGNIVLSYYDTTNNIVKFTYTSNGGSTWGAVSSIMTGLGGMGLSIKINPSTSAPAITFFDRSVNLLRYKYCSTALASCLTSTNWVDLGLGLIEASAGVSGLSAAATDGLLGASLTFSPTGQAAVVFSKGPGLVSAPITADLKFAYVSSTTGVFTTPESLNAGSNSFYTTPANFAAGGWMPASVRSSTGSLHSVYVGPGNHLYVTSCGH